MVTTRLFAGLCGLALLVSLGTTASALTIDDFLGLEELGVVRVSPDGKFAAAEVHGSLLRQPQLRSDYAQEARGELRIIDLSTAAAMTVHLPPGAGAWGPLWSPDGSRLAFMTNRGASVQLGVWEARSRKVSLLSTGSVNALANFGTVSRAPPGGRLPFAWVDSQHLVAVQDSGAGLDRDLGEAFPSEYFGRDWATSLQGGLSATVWNSRDPQVCGAADQLVRIDVATGNSEPLLSGAIRAASLSPDHRRALVTRAIPWRAADADAIAAPIPGYNGNDLDARVDTEVVVLSLEDKTASPPLLVRHGVSFFSADDFPVWSGSGSAVYVPAFRTDSDADLFRIDIGTFEVEHVMSGSRFTMRIAAALSRNASALSLDHSFEKGGDVNFREVGMALVSGGLLVFRDGRVLSLDGKGRIRNSLGVGEGQLVYPKPGVPVHERALYRRSDGSHVEVRVDAEGNIATANVPIPAGAYVVAYAPATGAYVFYEVKGAALRLSVLERDGSPRQIASFNEGFPTTDLPKKEIIDLGLPDRSRYAEITRPPGYVAGKQYPVVIYAYPGVVLAADNSSVFFGIHLAERPISLYQHVPLLLAASGYIVVRPSLPLTSAPRVGPLQSIGDELESVARRLIALGIAHEGAIGYYGHSYGGYTGLAAATYSRSIRAVVVAAAFADLLDYAWYLPPTYRHESCGPGLARLRAQELEGGAILLKMGGPPYVNIDAYVKNSALYSSSKIEAPLLMLHGEFDPTPISSVRKLYLSLERQGKEVELVQYWGESHILESPGNVRDAWARTREWFDRHLKLAGTS